MPKPPARPKPAMRWGVYTKRGRLIFEVKTRREAKWWTERREAVGWFFRRVMVTPIASKGER